ncbi:unnamed protein product, partial [Larinioides sclopetarius]
PFPTKVSGLKALLFLPDGAGAEKSEGALLTLFERSKIRDEMPSRRVL